MTDICEKFHNDPYVDPRTLSSIRIGENNYNSLLKECGNPPRVITNPEYRSQQCYNFHNVPYIDPRNPSNTAIISADSGIYKDFEKRCGPPPFTPRTVDICNKYHENTTVTPFTDKPINQVTRNNLEKMCDKFPTFPEKSTICPSFHENPTVDPRSKLNIGEKSYIYNDLVEECGPPSISLPLKSEVCPKFQQTPFINPYLGLPFRKENSQMSKWLEKECENSHMVPQVVVPKPPSPDTTEECAKFLRNPRVSPTSGQLLPDNSRAYLNLVNKCGTPPIPKPTDDVCVEFQKNPGSYPFTSTPINKGGYYYNKLTGECGPITETITEVITNPPSSSDVAEECNKFLGNPRVSPISGQLIPENSRPYQNLINKCGTPPIPKPTDNVCVEFQKNPGIYPFTTIPINQEGYYYNKLTEECGQTTGAANNEVVASVGEVNIPPEMCDVMGFEIFKTFDDKYRLGNKIFKTEETRIINMVRQKQITIRGYNRILDTIKLYEQSYNKFVDGVTNDRLFYEKSGSGSPPRKIIDAKDWGEAIIEFVNLVDNYKRDLKTAYDQSFDQKLIKDECKTYSIEQCELPCIKEKPFFGKPYCDYKLK